MEWKISDQDIELTEKILLPDGAHFPEDARNVIRCWHSSDVEACPGSGKTTVLLAKLKLLADRMPLGCGAGICVLSHTNVAVNEIKNRLSRYTDKLLGYPNYIGTIQSFVDKFVTLPYLHALVGRKVQVVDDIVYAQHMLNRMQNVSAYRNLEYTAKNHFNTSGQFTERLDHVKALYLRDDGALCVGKQIRILAGADKSSTIQYRLLIDDLLKKEGMIRYKDAYSYAEAAANNIAGNYKQLFSLRFHYVFIDEYQDCTEIQRQIIDTIFNPTKCAIIKIGDSDQAIYNSENKTPDWVPQEGFLSITSSCRYSQEIANVISKLKKDNKSIVTFAGKTGVKPILLVFAPEKIDRVINEFINILDSHGLCDNKGVYKVIGAVQKESLTGLKIGSYWPKFDGSLGKQNEYNYWVLVDDIITYLLEGKLYKVERTVRKLLCYIFHYANIRHPISDKEFSVSTIKTHLDNEYREVYRQWIYGLSELPNPERKTVDYIIRQKINELLKIKNPQANDIFHCLPNFFLESANVVMNKTEKTERNIFIDPIRGRRIEFNTIHGVKGETHDATLYLETERQGASDLSRILPFYGVGKPGNSDLFNYSRKLAYVAMSRPKKLLCVAMQDKTYKKSKGIFTEDWEIIDLRK